VAWATGNNVLDTRTLVRRAKPVGLIAGRLDRRYEQGAGGAHWLIPTIAGCSTMILRGPRLAATPQLVALAANPAEA
jgi:hypothetical protein